MEWTEDLEDATSQVGPGRRVLYRVPASSASRREYGAHRLPELFPNKPSLPKTQRNQRASDQSFFCRVYLVSYGPSRTEYRR